MWWDNNASISPAHFAAIKADFMAALKDKSELFVADLFGGSQPEYRANVRVINELAWHNQFIRTLLVSAYRGRARRLRARIHDSSTCPASAPIPRATAPAARP